jgi:hypothetical protein
MVTSKSAAEALRRDIRKIAYRERIDEMRRVFLITEDWQPLFKEFKGLIRRKAEYYGRKYRNARLYPDDFESEFWLAAWECAKEEHYSGDYYFFDCLIKRLDSRATDLIRKAYADKRKHIHFPVRYRTSQFHSESTNYRCTVKTTAEGVTVRRRKIPLKSEIERTPIMVAEQMAVKEIMDNSTAEEQRLIQLKLADPNLTLRELAESLELSHQEQVRRMFSRLNKKSKGYKEEIA